MNISEQLNNQIDQISIYEKYLIEELRIVSLMNSPDTLTFSLNMLKNESYLFKTLNIISGERSFRSLNFLKECTGISISLPSWFESQNRKSYGSLIAALIESLILHNVNKLNLLGPQKKLPLLQRKE